MTGSEPVEALRERLRSFLRLGAPSLACPPVERLSRQGEEGFTRSLLRYRGSDGVAVEAFLFEPGPSGQRGAVLALHQHNSQWELGKSEVAGLAADPLQAFGPALARRGIAVLAPDALGFESRLGTAGAGALLAPRTEKPYSTAEGWLQYYNAMAYRLVQGDLLMRTVLEDCAAALSVLQAETNAPRLGVTGHSLGGIVALFLAALDPRIAFACSSGAVCSYRHKLAHGTGLEMSLVIPGFARQFDFDDLLRCVAPRRMLVVSSTEDAQSADAGEVVARALPAFAAAGCESHLEHLRVGGPHALDERRFTAMVEWMASQATA